MNLRKRERENVKEQRGDVHRSDTGKKEKGIIM